MALTVYTNNYAISAQKNLTSANNSLSKSIERLSSGLRINHASDDASGLAISEKLRGQIRGMAKATINAQDAISFLQTAEGGMELIGDMLQRLRELAVQAGNGTYTANDRREIQKEVDQLKAEIDRISASTEFNTKKLLTGSSSGLWSSDSNAIEAIFRGAPAQGNYRLELAVDPGQNAIYKSDVMTVNRDFIQLQPGYKDRTVMKDFVASGNIRALDDAELKFGVFKTDDMGQIISGAITSASVVPMAYYQNESSRYSFEREMALTAMQTLLAESQNIIDTLGNAFELDPASKDAANTPYRDYTLADITYEVLGAVEAFNAVPKNAFLNAITAAYGPFTAVTSFNILESASHILSNYPDGLILPYIDPPFSDVTGYTTLGIDIAFGNVAYFILDPGIPQFDATLTNVELAGALTSWDETYELTKRILNWRVAEAKKEFTDTWEKVELAKYYLGVLPNAEQEALASPTHTATVCNDFIQEGNAIIGRSGFVEVEFLSDIADTTSGKEVPNVRFSFVDAATGEKIDKIYTLRSGATNSELMSVDGGYSLPVPVSGGVGSEIDFGNGVKFNFNLTAGSTMSNSITSGDKLLFKVQAAVKNNPAKGIYIDPSKDAMVTLEMMNDHDNDETTPPKLISGPVVYLPNGKNIGGKISGVALINGSFVQSSMSWQRNYNSQAPFSAANTAKFDAFLKGDVATTGVRLADLGLFTNPDGRMILDNTMTLTIYGNGTQTDITFEGDDTIEDILVKLQEAIYTGLDMGASDIDLKDLVHYVNVTSAQSYGLETVPGTFVLQTAKTGRQSQLSFIGDESLMNALSLVKIQQEQNSSVSVEVYDAHTNEFIGKDTVTDYTLRGIIKGVDVKIQSNFGLDISYDADARRMVFAPSENPSAFLHIVDKATEIQVGANEGQKFDISVEQIDTVSLEIADAYVMTMETSQKAITMFDQALEKVNHARATIGAQINRLEYSMQNLDTGRQNLTASESRIRDLDVAAESAEFAKNQILVNAAVAMLAQANQLPQTALQLIGGR